MKLDHPHHHPSSTEVKERVDLYVLSLSGPSWTGEMYLFSFQYLSTNAQYSPSCSYHYCFSNETLTNFGYI